ncbi:valine--tRNA ligase [Brevibacterium sp. UCMA 11752]|uniref:valine--tRNA ligase n=1 Tax=Brevibacterium sp. UCMA 11752 TaxID=2745946 RepID=UPI001F417AE2|nr:valine--tRNA ligase [Brevibacterium sp. UCMA 11752]MCF2588306.1 valine--tRNA ligase [Brevibacterium sp. UCMA 11752]
MNTPAFSDSTHESVNLPDKPALEGLRDKWDAAWSDSGVYAFDVDTDREQVYSIDTPPPTASGSLHVGHVFSYTQTDIIARYQRMQGKNVFYPLGWDDNGLPTERRVQNYYGVTCDPTQGYDPNFEPPAKPAKNSRDFVKISRQNFIELCETLSAEDEQIFEHLFRSTGLSVDWKYTYRTIDDTSRSVSQKAFLADLANGHAYSQDAPTMWDVTFGTAVAQAELEDRERDGAYHKVNFYPEGTDGLADTSAEPIVILTSRPELIPAVVALVAHPEDERYTSSFGSKYVSPLFGVRVEVRAHELAKSDKGTGIAMVCTFGDLTDVTWWRELDLPMRAVINRGGRLNLEVPEWIASSPKPDAVANYEKLAGKTTFTARKEIADMLVESGDLIGEIEAITHPVPFYEKGDKPLEVVTSRQWYIRNGGRSAELRDALIARGREIEWHPAFMRSRYENWVENLNGDWLVSRQRYFGVPIPLWYRLDSAGEPDYSDPIVPESLPTDPIAEVPAGFTADQRDVPGGFTADPDVLDTWATSSLTPQLLGGWSRDEDFFSKVFPFDLRPQGHDIIRTWLFSTVVRANSLNDAAPWKHAGLSGWILDPDRKKMSKSKGNVVVPSDILGEAKPGFGPDAVRYWAASAKLGADTAYDVTQMQIGRRLAMKLLNASKFALAQGVHSGLVGQLGSVTHDLDRALLKKLAEVVETASTHMAAYDYAHALRAAESFFWEFTDDYVELVKDRSYGAKGEDDQLSAHVTLATALDVLLRLFAPIMPFVTEEVWSWWRKGSVHRSPWPGDEKLTQPDSSVDPDLLMSVASVLTEIRRSKTEAKVSQKTQVRSLTIHAPAAVVAAIDSAQADLTAAGRIQNLVTEVKGEEITVAEIDFIEQD